MDQFYPIIPNKGHKSLNLEALSSSFSILGATKPEFLKITSKVPVSFPNSAKMEMPDQFW